MNSTAIVDHIVSWLKKYAEDAGCLGFAVGISGGIDSAVTSALCALTGLETCCVEMPIHQDINQVSRANKHIKQLQTKFPNVYSRHITLTESFDTLIKALPPSSIDSIQDLSAANTRARLRMTTLYFLAGTSRLLVAGTGNKVEDFGVGFYTKYGDGGVDLSPIADLTKSEVYVLGKELAIINEIMIAPPTDGLWGDSRTDEDQLGASYPELEWAMAYKGDEVNLSKREKEVLSIFRKLHAQNRHKMIPIPVCEIPASMK